MSRIKLTLFGSPGLTVDGEPADLAYLALTDVPHRRAALSTMFWPESDRVYGTNSLGPAILVSGAGADCWPTRYADGAKGRYDRPPR